MAGERFEELDDAICAHIRAGRGHPTNSSELEELDRPLLATNRTPFPQAWRLIDRRMQAMRNAGRLTYQRTKKAGRGWQVVDAQRPTS